VNGGHPRALPPLAPREAEVIAALCQPYEVTFRLTVTRAGTEPGYAFCVPPGTAQMAAALGVTEAAVKQHLLRLYAKFGIDGTDRRVRLANAVLAPGKSPRR